jgi:methionine-rich copper-binding protein CopC
MFARHAALAALLAFAAGGLVPGAALAHAELEASSPAAGAVLATPPVEVSGDFSQAVDAARSSMELRGPGGAVLARGGVPAAGPLTRMVIADLPILGNGEYEVRWTTVTADDDGVERGTFTFTVAAPTAPPTPEPPVPTPEPPATSSPAPGTPAPTAAATSSPAAVTPAPTTAPTPGPGAGPADLLLPLAALAVLLAAGGAWLARRRR